MSCCGKNNYGCAFNPDDEGPSEADIARFGSDDIACPSCGSLMYHDAPLCQSCGHAMTAADLEKTGSGKRIFITAVGVVTIAAFMLVMLP
jgi:uncharacterized protein (DUF983 family)